MLIIQLANWSASLRVVSHLHRLLGFKDCLDSGRLMAEIARLAWIALIALGKDDICIDFFNSISIFLSCLESCTVYKTEPYTTCFMTLNFIPQERLLLAPPFLYFVPPYLRMRPYEGRDHQQRGSPVPMELQPWLSSASDTSPDAAGWLHTFLLIYRYEPFARYPTLSALNLCCFQEWSLLLLLCFMPERRR